MCTCAHAIMLKMLKIMLPSHTAASEIVVSKFVAKNGEISYNILQISYYCSNVYLCLFCMVHLSKGYNTLYQYTACDRTQSKINLHQLSKMKQSLALF